MKTKEWNRKSVPPEKEPQVEAWLERRGIPFEVCISGKKMFVYADFGACTDVKKRAYLEAIYENFIQKIRGGKNRKNKGGSIE